MGNYYSSNCSLTMQYARVIEYLCMRVSTNSPRLPSLAREGSLAILYIVCVIVTTAGSVGNYL